MSYVALGSLMLAKSSIMHEINIKLYVSYIALVRKEIQDETDKITGKSKQISPIPIHLSIYSPNGMFLLNV